MRRVQLQLRLRPVALLAQRRPFLEVSVKACAGVVRLGEESEERVAFLPQAQQQLELRVGRHPPRSCL
jgi:hypothetical protein